jgi:molybdate transport system regulatory protein
MISSRMPRLTLRIDFDQNRAIGPGKIKLLELIDALGSISAAGRQMKMSYRRAWLLVDSLNKCFSEPLVASQAGGPHGGGAALTPAGAAVVRHYRAVEAAAYAAGAAHIDALDMALAPVLAAEANDAKEGPLTPRRPISERRAARPAPPGGVGLAASLDPGPPGLTSASVDRRGKPGDGEPG